MKLLDVAALTASLTSCYFIPSVANHSGWSPRNANQWSRPFIFTNFNDISTYRKSRYGIELKKLTSCSTTKMVYIDEKLHCIITTLSYCISGLGYWWAAKVQKHVGEILSGRKCNSVSTCTCMPAKPHYGICISYLIVLMDCADETGKTSSKSWTCFTAWENVGSSGLNK